MSINLDQNSLDELNIVIISSLAKGRDTIPKMKIRKKRLPLDDNTEFKNIDKERKKLL